MRVTAKSDYALRALVELAAASRDASDDSLRDNPISAEELGRRQEIPHGFLQAILSDLRRAGVVASRRGKTGGGSWPAAPTPSPWPRCSGRSTGRW